MASVASFVCVFIVSSFIANPHGREGAGMMSFGLFGGLDALPALAVPCGLASAASFVGVVIDSSFKANPHGRECAGMMSLGLIGGQAHAFKKMPLPNCYEKWSFRSRWI